MKLPPTSLLMLLSALALTACAWTPSPTAHRASNTPGVVEGFIDPDTPADQLPPCVARQLAKLRGGTRFAVLGYRHWASHFHGTAYTALADGTALQLHQKVLMVPGDCNRGELAQLLEPTWIPVMNNSTP
ncbi:hypothetical protein [Herbaspirillum huttiense]|uniref:hypothetical protein n=1 Tax=Herbaspirillum huttiense TaxID=863372 RepID=UPI0021769824|nr:hypothetical protein [Herbaspirillum huttiense]UWE19078.1 hypothetical protein NY669_13125 [Herbaspirillum huttiense]